MRRGWRVLYDEELSVSRGGRGALNQGTYCCCCTTHTQSQAYTTHISSPPLSSLNTHTHTHTKPLPQKIHHHHHSPTHPVCHPHTAFLGSYPPRVACTISGAMYGRVPTSVLALAVARSLTVPKSHNFSTVCGVTCVMRGCGTGCE